MLAVCGDGQGDQALGGPGSSGPAAWEVGFHAGSGTDLDQAGPRPPGWPEASQPHRVSLWLPRAGNSSIRDVSPGHSLPLKGPRTRHVSPEMVTHLCPLAARDTSAQFDLSDQQGTGL